MMPEHNSMKSRLRQRKMSRCGVFNVGFEEEEGDVGLLNRARHLLFVLQRRDDGRGQGDHAADDQSDRNSQSFEHTYLRVFTCWSLRGCSKSS